MFRHRERFVKIVIVLVTGAMVLSLVGGMLLAIFGNG
jgi:hypothetical protein